MLSIKISSPSYGKLQNVARGTKLASQTVQRADRGVIGKEADERRGLLEHADGTFRGAAKEWSWSLRARAGMNAPLLKELRELREF
jgi:hypothetical protein